MAIDFNTSLFKSRLAVIAEAVKILVDVPDTYTQVYGNSQLGGYVDVVATVIQRKIGDWEKAKINAGFRLEYADYNQGRFKETQQNIGDDLWAIVPSLAFRPVGNTATSSGCGSASKLPTSTTPPSARILSLPRLNSPDSI